MKTNKLKFFIIVFLLSFSVQTLAQDDGNKSYLKVTKSQEEQVKRIHTFFISSLGKDAKDYKFQIKKSKIQNAYASPGKKVTLTTALINSVKSEAGLAFVIAHEIGHLERKHLRNSLGRSLVGFMGAIGLGFLSKGGNAAGVVYKNGYQVANKFFSRDQERSADLFAADLMMRHYCNVPGKLEFFEEMLKKNQGNDLLRYFSTHPMTTERIIYLKEIFTDGACAL